MTPWAGKPRLIAICHHAAKVEQNIHLIFVIIFPDLLYRLSASPATFSANFIDFRQTRFVIAWS
jgi:hypothetical protein